MRMPSPYIPRDHLTPLETAQENLWGRTHYVDDDTLRYHKSRVLDCKITDNGLLLGIVTSDAVDHQDTRREFRYVIFDVFGTVIARPDLGHGFRSRRLALKALWAALDAINAAAITLDGLKDWKAQTEDRAGLLRKVAMDMEADAQRQRDQTAS